MSGKRVGAGLFLFWLMIAGQASAIGAQKLTAEQHIERAREALGKKEYRDAEKELKKALSLKKDSAEANLLLGLAYRHWGELDKAFKHVREAIRLQPNFHDARYLMAYLYFIKNQLKEAAKEVKLALDQGAQYPIIYLLKANLEIRDRKFDDALKSYEMALQLSQSLDGSYQKVSEQVELLKSYIAFKPLKDEFSAHKDDPAYKKPILKNRPMPSYSSLARAKKIQGIVHANIRVNEQGVPDAVLIVQGVGYGLDEEAIKAALATRFSPATRNGEPVKFWLIMLVEFNIRSRY